MKNHPYLDRPTSYVWSWTIDNGDESGRTFTDPLKAIDDLLKYLSKSPITDDEAQQAHKALTASNEWECGRLYFTVTLHKLEVE